MSESERHVCQHAQQGRGDRGSRRRRAERARRASGARRRRRARRGPPAAGAAGGGGLLERPELSDELIDELLAGARTAEEIAGPDGLLGQLTRRLLERALRAEITEHLGYEHGHAPPGGTGNSRNGAPPKTVLTDQGPVRVRSPRDRAGTFEPKIVGKRQTRWVGFDERVIALYARGRARRASRSGDRRACGVAGGLVGRQHCPPSAVRARRKWMARFFNARVPEAVQPFWATLQGGEFIADAAVAAGTYRKQGTRWVAAVGGVRPRRAATSRAAACRSPSARRSRSSARAASRCA